MERDQLELKFKELLEPVLPKNEEFEFIDLHSLPQKCRKLIFTKSSDKQLDTQTTHFPLILYKLPNTNKKVAIYALEVYIYESLNTSTMFVSKADTSGHYTGEQRINMLKLTQAILSILIRFYTPLNKRLRICLFAKAQKEYLFLGSLNNPQKHCLSDADLVKWWVKCLDMLGNEFKDVNCSLTIPGINDLDAKKYLPLDAKLSWFIGDIFFEHDDDEDMPAVKRIPRFPDDPKSRFLDFLVSERRAKTTTRKQFFLELQTRQEFLLSKSVGIIGLQAQHLNEDVHFDLSKTNCINSKKLHKFKEHLVSLKFNTMENAINGTQNLMKAVPTENIISLVGKQEVELKRKKVELVNNLLPVRKKVKH